jgi:ABC-type lipoprotein export system ATPase subunit
MSITAQHLGKTIGDPPVQVLTDLNIEISDGEFVALTGRSGSGKSTLLYILSSLDSASEGSVVIDGQDLSKLTSEKLHEFRNLHMGFVFQFHYLISELTVFENVLMPARKFEKEASLREYAKELLNRFGLGDKLYRYPRQLSGGEQQRVAIARSLIMSPKYLFADEPTGSLDTVNAETVMTILREINRDHGTTVILVTHDLDYANEADRKIELVDGKLATS